MSVFEYMCVVACVYIYVCVSVVCACVRACVCRMLVHACVVGGWLQG